MVGRNPLRYVAPIVLVVAIIGAALIVANHTGGSGSSQSPQVVKQHHGPRGKYANATFYTVQPGDNLTAIASKTGVSVLTLEQLNQSLDPNSLQTGEKLRLRQ
jgi:LysM repeat protein